MKICKIENCDKPYKAKNLCAKHIQRLYKRGSYNGFVVC
jgi:hypothetical protein